MDPIRVGIIGGTGYTGVELLRLLAGHTACEITSVASRSEAGKPVSDLFPSLRGSVDLVFTQPDTDAFKDCDVVFSATPNGVAMEHARGLLDAGVKLIDLAADFRIKDIEEWERWYGLKHGCPELVEEAVYGLPELNREQIKSARLVANPGCYPTATSLGFLPLLKLNRLDNLTLIADAKSGVSGAGRGVSVANLFAEVADSFKAYGVSAHRHHPEITQILSSVAEKPVNLTFIPHLVPMLRGILATLYADLQQDVTLEQVQRDYESFYANHPFVDVMPLGSHPETRSVKSSNMCRIALHRATGSDKLVVISTIDNLTKGAAGQAVQNMNLMFGLDESYGLTKVGLQP